MEFLNAIGWTAKASDLEQVFSVKDTYPVPENEILPWGEGERVRSRSTPPAREMPMAEGRGYGKAEREVVKPAYGRDMGKNKGNNRQGGSWKGDAMMRRKKYGNRNGKYNSRN